MRAIEGDKVHIKVWTDINQVENKAMEQLRNISSMPFVFKHVAAMPDVHLGIGATVGSVIATKGAIMPCAVGVDIGCGMMAVRLDCSLEQVKDKASEIRHSIERSIPVGFNNNKETTEDVDMWDGWHRFPHLSINDGRDYYERLTKAQMQLGTLGGGNHFIELCEDSIGNPWVMLHSGSRGIGNIVARNHIDRAKDTMKAMFISLPDPDLAYFAESTKDFHNYMKDLEWCQEYALFNRQEMMRRVIKDISYALGFGGKPIARLMEVNCHHNYASRENHYGENVIITRKGAVRARFGDLGIIPGSMGTRSYIVSGLGNRDSFHSCSHGAGRRMSRTQAKLRFSLADLAEQTKGVDCRKDSDVIDEIPGAYKDIDEVMENQKDLVEIVATLKQFVCVKG